MHDPKQLILQRSQNPASRQVAPPILSCSNNHTVARAEGKQPGRGLFGRLFAVVALLGLDLLILLLHQPDEGVAPTLQLLRGYCEG